MLVLSDIHIGSSASKINILRKCLQKYYDKIIVIAGDIYEKEYRKVTKEEAAALFRRLTKTLDIKPKLLLISLSSASHDPQVGYFSGEVDGVEVVACNCPIAFTHEGANYVVAHGDMAISDGILAYLADLVRPGTVGRILRRKLKIGNETWLIYGHSHVPYLNIEERILNPGPWKVYGFRRILGSVYELPSARPICKPNPQ